MIGASVFILLCGISSGFNMANMPSEEMIYDAIVAGAGPGGCACALFLARAGRQVLLVDKAAFPREKVCGDAVSGKSVGVMRELGLLKELDSPAHGVIKGVLFCSPSAKEVAVPFPNATGLEFAGYTLRRKQTDQILFEAASAEKNITIMQKFRVENVVKGEKGEVCGIEGTDGMAPPRTVEGGNFEVKENSSSKRIFHSRVVVGADGAGSAVSRSLGLPPIPPEHQFMAIRGYWRGVEDLSDNIELFFIDGVLPGYLWVFPMGDGTANVGLGILMSDLKKRSEHPNKILYNALSGYAPLARRFKPSLQEGQIGAWTIPNGSYKKQNAGDGWMLVGDAASLVDPFSGEGFGNAVSSGKFAAQAIDDAIKANAGSEPLPCASLAPYSERVEAELRPEMEMSYKLQQASRHRFLLNMFIGKAATKPEFRKIIVDMLANDEEKKKVQDPLFYLKLLLP